MRTTKKKLEPFLNERGLELHQYLTSYVNYYYMARLGAGPFQSGHADLVNKFYNLRDLFDFLISHPNYNWQTLKNPI